MLIERRALLGLSAGLFAWAFAPRIAEAAPGDEPRLLVVLLRGGMDGLHVVAPLGDDHYATLRGDLALTPSGVNPLISTSTNVPRGFFGLNKAMPSFYSMYNASEASIIHAIAPPLQIGSHFECQYNLESGFPGDVVRSAKDGWMNRLMSVLPAGNRVKALGALEIGPTPLITMGKQPIQSWTPGGWGTSPAMAKKLYDLYAQTYPVYGQMLQSGLETAAFADGAVGNLVEPNTLQKAFAGAGKLMGKADGPRIAVLSIDGWDTHANQMKRLGDALGPLDGGLTLLKSNMGSAAWARTVVVCVTEFGRTAAVNGQGGTDHGVGTVALMAGGAVAGQKIHADWPGLGAADLLSNRNLKATLDLRALFKGILQDHLGVSRQTLDAEIFPGSSTVPPMAGLIRSPVPITAASAAARMAWTARLDSPIARYREANPAPR